MPLGWALAMQTAIEALLRCSVGQFLAFRKALVERETWRLSGTRRSRRIAKRCLALEPRSLALKVRYLTSSYGSDFDGLIHLASFVHLAQGLLNRSARLRHLEPSNLARTGAGTELGRWDRSAGSRSFASRAQGRYPPSDVGTCLSALGIVGQRRW